jgi:predicted acetyltransferase
MTSGPRHAAAGTLRAALPVAAELGIHPAVVSVRIGNHASRRVIEANGGLLVETRADHLRFRLPTTHTTATYVD